VRVGKHHRIDLARIEGEGLAVARLLLAPALDKAAIDQHPALAAVNQETGTGHLASRTEKLHLHGPIPPRSELVEARQDRVTHCPGA